MSNPNSLLRMRDLIGPDWVNASRSTVYRMLAAGKIPPPIRVSERVRAWPRAVIEKALADLASGGERP